MMTVSRSVLSLCTCFALMAAVSASAEDHNSTRSNSGTSIGEGDGDITEGDATISNDKIVRKRPGRTTYSNLDSGPDWEPTIGSIRVEMPVGESPDELLSMLYYELRLAGASDAEAIEYALIAALMD